jgi:hypothetical protein
MKDHLNQSVAFYPRELCGAARRELCHTRDSGAVSIASLVRRTAAIYFVNGFLMYQHGKSHGVFRKKTRDSEPGAASRVHFAR